MTEERRLELLEQAVKTINEELGDILLMLGRHDGKLGLMVWFMGGTTLILLGAVIKYLMT